MYDQINHPFGNHFVPSVQVNPDPVSLQRPKKGCPPPVPDLGRTEPFSSGIACASLDGYVHIVRNALALHPMVNSTARLGAPKIELWPF